MKKGFGFDFKANITLWILIPTVILSADKYRCGIGFAWLCIITAFEYEY